VPAPWGHPFRGELEPAPELSVLEGDLYGRLRLVVHIPPLNDRREDLPALTQLLLHDYQYNVRELQSLLEQSFIESEDTLVVPNSLLDKIPQPSQNDLLRQQAERELAKQGGNQSAAARALKITRWTLLRRLGLIKKR
jgi:transcriptional regulator of acetoin/glycerol metabolism